MPNFPSNAFAYNCCPKSNAIPQKLQMAMNAFPSSKINPSPDAKKQNKQKSMESVPVQKEVYVEKKKIKRRKDERPKRQITP